MFYFTCNHGLRVGVRVRARIKVRARASVRVRVRVRTRLSALGNGGPEPHEAHEHILTSVTCRQILTIRRSVIATIKK